MPSANEQVWLSKEANLAIQSGLNIVICGMAEIRLGFKRAPHMTNPELKHLFAWRQFDPECETVVLNLRNKLQAKSVRPLEKFRFAYLELAAAAFGLRLATKNLDPAEHKELSDKLEIYRRRARRTYESKHGAEAYRNRQERWHGFTGFVRYYVLKLRVPKRNRMFRALHREQFESLLNIANEVVDERCVEPVAEAELVKVVRLAKRRVRRGRHECTLRELLAQPEKAKAFLFDFLRERIDLKLKFEYLSLDLQQSERADKFRAVMVVQELPPVSLGPSAQEVQQSKPAKKLCAAPAVKEQPVPVSLGSITPPNARARLAKIFGEEILPLHWQNVLDQVTLLASGARPPCFAKPPVSLEELIKACRPDMEINDGPDEVNYAVDYLLNITLALGASPSQAIDLVQGAYGLAVSR